MIAHQYHLPVIECLDVAQIDYVIYSDIQADPPEEIVLNAAAFCETRES